jgi:hypothetical protein
MMLFLNQVLNKNIMISVPLIYSMYLSNVHFEDAGTAFVNTKQAILNLLTNVSNTDNPPAPTPSLVASRIAAEQASGGNSNLDGLMREIMLKVLRETPIAILKGIAEMIDPHVALTKMIRDLTGPVFDQVASAIDASLASTDLADVVTGEQLLGLVFCIMNIGNQAAAAAIEGPGGPGTGLGDDYDGPLLGPHFSMKGIDFTGSVAGMFMAPPSPLGVLYLLFMMLLNTEIPIDGSDEPQMSLMSPPDSEC